MSFFDDASLLQIPSGYKDDKLYSIKPTDGAGDFTFSRDGSGASVATRINSSGLIEKGHTNQILQSNQFDTTWGVSGGASVSSGQSGYDGTTNAWRFIKDSAFDGVSQDTSGLGITNVNTISVYAKRVDIDEFILRLIVGGNTRIIRWDLTDGSLNSAHADYIAPIDGVAIGTTGFYRFSATINGTLSKVEIRTDSTITAGSVDIQAVQVQKGLVATTYIDTTTAAASAGLLGDMPRLDYSDGASCPCVLFEPARENKLAHSEYFGAWNAQTGITITDNTTDTLSPEGVNNAAKITSTDGTTGFYLTDLSITNPAIRTIYLKGAAGGESISLKDGSGNGGTTSITLTTEWVRYEHKTTNTGDTYQGLFVDDIPSGATIYAYGAQFEEHPTATAQEANATSYVPTYGTAVERAYDVTSELTYDDDLTSVVLFGEITMADAVRDASGYNIRLRKASGSGSFLAIYRNSESSKRMAAFRVANNSNTALIDQETTAEHVKIAMQYNAGNGSVKVFVNGSNALASSITDPDFDEFVKFQLSGQQGTMKVHQFAALKATYTNDELATLTTL